MRQMTPYRVDASTTGCGEWRKDKKPWWYGGLRRDPPGQTDRERAGGDLPTLGNHRRTYANLEPGIGWDFIKPAHQWKHNTEMTESRVGGGGFSHVAAYIWLYPKVRNEVRRSQSNIYKDLTKRAESDGRSEEKRWNWLVIWIEGLEGQI